VTEGVVQAGTGGSDEPADVLRAKYLDYCSAQLAELLLYLSPDDIFVLSRRISERDARAESPGWDRLVAVATEWLSERVALPPFDVWVRHYREDPERYEADFMGLWESGVGAREGGGPA